MQMQIAVTTVWIKVLGQTQYNTVSQMLLSLECRYPNALIHSQSCIPKILGTLARVKVSLFVENGCPSNKRRKLGHLVSCPNGGPLCLCALRNWRVKGAGFFTPGLLMVLRMLRTGEQSAYGCLRRRPKRSKHYLQPVQSCLVIPHQLRCKRYVCITSWRTAKTWHKFCHMPVCQIQLSLCAFCHSSKSTVRPKVFDPRLH